MIIKTFTVYDSKAEIYSPPFYEITAGQAIRAFTDASNQEKHPFALHPGDYTLFELGHYDNANGQHENLKTPINHGLALIYKSPTNIQPILKEA